MSIKVQTTFKIHVTEAHPIHDADNALREARRLAFKETLPNQTYIGVELVDTIVPDDEDYVTFVFEVTRSYRDN